jgi:cation diffusion facilitator family transporter
MIALLGRIFIKDAGEYHNPHVRRMYGMLCSIVGITLNIILFGIKFFAGAVTGSVAIMADAFNNLTDAGSSIITLIGFKFAGMKPDREHPFGHGRIEYVSGLIVAISIILVGFELGRSSIEKIFHPEIMETGSAAVIILIISILVKFYMASYNSRIGKKISSSAMKATAMDSLSDVIATSVVLVDMGIMYFFGINVDGYCGAVVALFILWTGYQTAKETVSPLLGGKPDAELIEQIHLIVLGHQGIVGIHDVIVHDYGPGRMMLSLHVEVPGDENIFKLHELIEHIESDLDGVLNCESVIHMDPIETKNEIVVAMREKISELVMKLDSSLSIHDFRMVTGDSRTSVIFDVVAPQEFVMTDEELRKEIEGRIQKQYPNHYAVIKVEKAYV